MNRNFNIGSATGRGVRVLVLDSGIEFSHPALAGIDVKCWEVVPGTLGYTVRQAEDGVDVYGHGTAAAGIIREFAPDASIESLRVLGNDLRATSRSVLAGLRWAIETGYDIVNCSFGTSNNQFLSEYKEAVDEAFCRNVLLVSACNNFNFRRLEYPGSFPTVLSSDFGPLEGLCIMRRVGCLVEFVARGQNIRVAWNNGQWRRSTGSSFASSHLAALVARLRELQPSWNACEIKTAIYEIAAPFKADSPLSESK